MTRTVEQVWSLPEPVSSQPQVATMFIPVAPLRYGVGVSQAHGSPGFVAARFNYTPQEIVSYTCFYVKSHDTLGIGLG